MSEKKNYELDFEEYIRNSEPEKKEKTYVWSTAIGLQQVDGLTPSKYLFDTAKRSIEGDITFEQAKSIIDSYYESKSGRNSDEDERTEEADKVSARIAQILSEKSFNFSPSHLIAIHGRLFEGIFNYAGKIRDYDISKKEWVLDGDPVLYGAAFELNFAADNDIFTDNSWYFRNALVRANYTNLQKGINESPEFLELFFRNLLLGEHNELKNRYLHIRYVGEQEMLKQVQYDRRGSEKSSEKKTVGSEKTSGKILALLKENPEYSAVNLAEILGISSRAVEKHISALKKAGKLERQGADKGGKWVVL